MSKKSRVVEPFIGPPRTLERAVRDEYERIDAQSRRAPEPGPFGARPAGGEYGGVASAPASEPLRGGRAVDVATLEDHFFSLRFQDQLRLVRSLAPRVLEHLSPNDREAFFIALGEELDRRVGGQGTLPYM